MELSARNLTVTGPSGRILAQAEALDVPSGGTLGLAGPSGAGKSTLLFALAGLSPGTAGSVRWGGTDLIRLRGAARRAMAAQSFGLVFQDFLLIDEMDAASNAGVAAMFAPARDRAALRARAAEHLATFGLSDPARPVASFSGGERQRVAVARALATNPPVVLADEPTASLDRDSADQLIDQLTGAARTGGKTLICVSHDPALLDRMDRVLHMRDGVLSDA